VTLSLLAWQPLVWAARALRRDPAGSLLAIGTMAVGIGLATAMLAVLNGTVWRPLAFPSADRLVAIQGPVSSETVADWSSSARSFDGLAGYRTKRYTLTGVGDAVSLRATVSTGTLFALLDARAASGRVLDRSDDRGAAPAVVVADRCWRSTFHADPSLPGRTIDLNGTPFLVAGIMPPGFQFPVNTEAVDLYTTLAADLQTDRRPAEGARPRDLMVVARLKAGVELAQARTEMARLITIADETGAVRPAHRPAQVVPLASDVSASLVSPLTALAGAVSGVLAIACATASILSLIRVTSRRDEWATRIALGATHGDLARQLLAESVVIALAGGVIGALIAAAVSRPILLVAGPAVSAAARARFDARVFMWAGLASVTAAALFGAVPAVQAAATRWSETRTARHVSGSPASAVRGLLVTAEIALVVILVAGCISLLRAYVTLSHADTGFKPAGVLTFRVDLSDAAYSARRQAELFERLRSDAVGVPGVDAAAFTALPPFGGLRFTIRLDAPEGTLDERRRGGAEVHLVSPGFFRAMRIPLVEGREFSGEDRADRDPVIIVSRAAAARQFPGQDPIGRRLDVRVGPNASGPLPRIVGVVGDIKDGSLTAPGEPQVYLPYAQAPMLPSTTFVVRVREGDQGAIVAAIRQHLRRLDPTVPLVSLRPLDDFLWSAMSLPRFTTLLVGVFAAAAVFLGMAGLYAVVSYGSLCRRREYSIRRALGATQARVAGLVVRQCLKVLIPGLALGTAGSVALDRVLESVIYGVRPSPAPTIAAALAVTAVLSLLATWWPARSAGRDNLCVRLQSNV
jgi:predicted permease